MVRISNGNRSRSSEWTIRTRLPMATDVTVMDFVWVNEESGAVTEVDKRHGGLWTYLGKNGECHYV